ncbi:histidine kinase [Reinekea sp.]|uniref:histidine kinase n=1 Tax=Reinekea sp. TaxID=1970455 RepID=UPI0039891432
MILVLISSIASFSAQLIAKEVYGDALAVNLSGSLRMQSYRIANAIQSNENEAALLELAREFSDRLDSPELKGYIKQESIELDNQYLKVHNQWQRMEYDLFNDPRLFLADVEGFVDEIDILVSSVQQWSEEKIAWLRAWQASLLIVTLLIALAFSLFILLRFVKPMVSLRRTIGHIQHGRLEARSKYEKEDEFGDLSKAINNLADDLIEANGKLSVRLAQSNKELAVNYNALEFLFRISQSLAGSEPNLDQLKDQVIEELSQQFESDSIYWELNYSHCKDNHESCFRAGTDPSFSLVYCSAIPLQNWQKYTMTTICELFETAHQTQLNQYNNNRIALMNERNNLARELHDSLAQSLSFLKMQVARWQKLQARNEQAALPGVVEEIKEGLGDSYRSLRELLVTFRSQLDQPGLVPALEAAIDMINRANNLSIELKSDANWPIRLSAAQEINCLHIVREALTNVAKHSQAEHALVNLKVSNSNLVVEVIDDGIGFDTNTRKANHFGLEIMHERAIELRGEITFLQRDSGGIFVTLTFPQTKVGIT